MKLNQYWYKVDVVIEFTRTEVEHLTTLAKQHYDYKCKCAANCGGFLYGMKNSLDFQHSASERALKSFEKRHANQVTEQQLTIDELDMLCKIAEGEQFMDEKELKKCCMWFPLKQALKAAIAESNRINKEKP